MLNPFTCPIEGDLSRADVVVLTQLCRGKDVVEFGVGGSTLLLARVAKSLTSFDTDPAWIERVSVNLEKIPGDKTCIPTLVEIPKHAGSAMGRSQPCDVLFDDGWSMLRWPFLFGFWQDIRECAILHDTRLHYAGNVLKQFIDAWDPDRDKEKYPCGYNPYLATLEGIDWNYLESNMAVLRKRNCSLSWEDWKKTEADSNRVGYGKV